MSKYHTLLQMDKLSYEQFHQTFICKQQRKLWNVFIYVVCFVVTQYWTIQLMQKHQENN